jgi:cytochrome c biogenesis protein CcmG, thiol:disulfide interchange protein DsbE
MRLASQALAVAAVVALLGLLVWKVTRDEGGVASKLRAGEPAPAPAFALPELDGDGEISLASLRGKAIVINFWASWCRPCKKEAPLLEAAWRKYRDRGVVVLGIDSEDFRGDGRKFVDRYGITYPNVHTSSRDIVVDFGLMAYPETFFVDREGEVVAHVQGEIDREDLERGIELALGAAT